jgi:hypothetical protein
VNSTRIKPSERRQSGSSISVGENKTSCQFGVLHDITELRKAEQELSASEARLERAQAIANVGWWERARSLPELSRIY